MNNDINIKELLAAEFPNCDIEVSGQGCNFKIDITHEIFAGKNRVARQRLVNRVIEEHLQNGTIHAVTIIAKAPGE